MVLVIHSVSLSNCNALLELACTSSQERTKWPQLGGFRSARVGVLISQELVKYCKLGPPPSLHPHANSWLVRQWHPTPVLLPGKSHGWRSLVGCSPWGREESDMTVQLHFHFSLSCIGEGNGNPVQCSCLENLRDGGAWWASVYGVAQSRTQLKWLSSSSSSKHLSAHHWISVFQMQRK